MRPVILRHKWLSLIGVLCALLGCGHKKPPPAQPEASAEQSITVETAPPVIEQPSALPAPEEKPDTTVVVKGYGAIMDDIQKARDEALMDAYNKAIGAGLGVKVYGKTVVKQFQLVEHFVMTQRKGYVKSFKILNENPESQSGYEVEIEAVVSNDPISAIDDLKFTIDLMGNPRLMVYIESEDKNRSIVEGYITGPLKKAGYALIDSRQIEKLKERDFKERRLLGDWKAAAILGNRLGAEVAIVGNISTEVATRREGEWPIVVAFAQVHFKVIATETGEILHSITDTDIPNDDDRKGTGGTDARAINQATAKAVGKVAEKLMWELPSKIGLVTVRLLVRDCTYEQAEQLAGLIKPLRIVEDVRLLNYQNSIAEIDIGTSGRTQNLVSHLRKIQDVNFAIERVALGAIEIKVLKT